MLTSAPSEASDSHVLCNRRLLLLVLSVVFVTLFAAVIPRTALAASPFADAFGLWNFQTGADSSGNGNDLTPEPSASLGVALTGSEKASSLAHNGDGYVAQTSGPPILAGKTHQSLVVDGDQITIYIRVKDPTGAWGGELVKRREPVMSYNVYTFDFGQGPRNMTLGFEIGTSNNPFNSCKFVMDRLPDRKAWLDIVARYDGKKMQLIVNGVMMATSAASGPLAPGPDDQFMIGNKFQGQFDTVAIWKRALTDAEVSDLSKTKTITESPYLDTSTNKGPYYDRYLKLIADYDKSASPYSELYRPQFHWTPISGWMNDPNGLVYFNGLWHQFAQHNLPDEAGKRWAYATSKDLVHWTQHPEAIVPDSLGEIWSGSAVVDQHDTSGFFHGKPGIVCIYTYFNGNEGGRQCQAIAYSADGVTFTKYKGNPVIPELRYVTGQEDDVDFRDPKVFWYEPTQRWIMVTGGGFIRIWSSPNLRDWTNEAVEKDIQTECPDLFPLHLDNDLKSPPVWVLSRAGASYMLGTFDGHRFTPSSPGVHKFNFGPDFYASQTYSNVPDGRRIMSTWMWGWGDDDPAGITTTGGMMTLPVELDLVSTPDGPRITSNPVDELQVLRGVPSIATNVDLSAATPVLDSDYGNQCEIIANIDMRTATNAGLSLLQDSSGAVTTVGYDAVKKEVYIDRSKSGITSFNKAGNYIAAPLALKNNQVQLHVFVDHATVEAFAGNGLTPITIRCYPPKNAKKITAFATGGDARITSIQIYPMSSIWKK